MLNTKKRTSKRSKITARSSAKPVRKRSRTKLGRKRKVSKDERKLIPKKAKIKIIPRKSDRNDWTTRTTSLLKERVASPRALQAKAPLFENENKILKYESANKDKASVFSNKKLEEAEQKINEYEAMAKKVKDHRDKLLAEIKGLRVRLREIQRKHETSIEQNKRTHNEQLRELRAAKDKKINDQAKQMEEISSKVSRMKHRVSNLETTKQAEIGLLKSKLSDVLQKVAPLRAMVNRIQEVKGQMTTSAAQDLEQKILEVSSLNDLVAQLTEKNECADKSLRDFRQEFQHNLDILNKKLWQKTKAFDSLLGKFNSLQENKNQLQERLRMCTSQIENLEKEKKVSDCMEYKKSDALKNQIKVLETKLRIAQEKSKQLSDADHARKLALERLMKELKFNINNASYQKKTIIALKIEVTEQIEQANVARTKRDQTIKEVQVELGRIVKIIENKNIEVKNLWENMEIIGEKLEKASKTGRHHDLNLKKAKQMWQIEREKHHLLLKAKVDEVEKSKKNEMVLKEKVRSLESEIKQINRDMASVTAEFVGPNYMVKTFKHSQTPWNYGREQPRGLNSDKTQLQLNLAKIKAFAKDLKVQMGANKKAKESLKVIAKKVELENQVLTKDKTYADKSLERARAQGVENKTLQVALEKTADWESRKRMLVEEKASQWEAAINSREQLLQEARTKLREQESAHKNSAEDHQDEIEGYEEAIKEKDYVIKDLNEKLNVCMAARKVVVYPQGPPPMIPPGNMFK